MNKGYIVSYGRKVTADRRMDNSGDYVRELDWIKDWVEARDSYGEILEVAVADQGGKSALEDKQRGRWGTAGATFAFRLRFGFLVYLAGFVVWEILFIVEYFRICIIINIIIS